MTTGTEYDTSYKKAYTAYVQGKHEEAAAQVELLAREYPDDPNILLLQGHICLNRQQYAVARQCYESVLAKSQQQDLEDCARQGLAQLEEWQQTAETAAPQDFRAVAPAITPVAQETDRATIQSGIDDLNWDSDISHLVEDADDNTINEAGLSFPGDTQEWSTPAKSSSINVEEESFLKQLNLTNEELSEIYQLESMEVSSELRQLTDLPTAEFSDLLDQQILEAKIRSQGSGVRIKEDSADIALPPAQLAVRDKNRWLTRFTNASLYQKQLLVAAAAGLAPVFAILIFMGATWLLSPKEPLPKKSQPASVANVSSFSEHEGWLLLLAGGSSFGITLLLGQLAARQVKQGLDNLEDCFVAISQGELNTRATVDSTDEIGQLAASFNEFWQEIATTAGKAEQRASEIEQAKEQLQRQVIHLLDEVEGASRGDLTVEAKVTADILGAVADAFNLTIQNLREILQQVKQAAKQVTQAATDSASFARKNSQESLRMAGELAFTLQSVEMMNESIQRVAESAKEAENVARTASVTAIKGGKAVELTVTGVMSIRETVSDTARKVKRLAEASQEISKIVAAVSQISSRTNLLALNASLQAARAGEAGRGFAVVADEVRQLADRSAKSLKEIEQIVVQIQGETSSVMAAMEEGIQQVLDVSEKSEQAKSALDAIIEVSNHIDQLLQSITADTIQQKENSQSVAEFMKSVEITAQTTSQESQRVAGSLQKLVPISRDLLASVNKFRLES